MNDHDRHSIKELEKVGLLGRGFSLQLTINVRYKGLFL